MTLGRPRRHLGAVASTMDEAAAWADAGAPHGAVVTTDHQTGGRGRRGRVWVDAPGESLLASVVLRSLPPDRLGLVPLAAGLAIATALEEAGVAGARVKWPNDVLLEGRKVAGVLTEARHGPDGTTAVVGMGVNVAQSSFPEALADRATSLRLATGAPVDRDALLESILRDFGSLLDEIETAPAQAFVRRFEDRMAQRGERVTVVGLAGTGTSGTALGIAPDGALRLDVDGTERPVYAGEVASSPRRVLAVDVGNSAVKAGLHDGDGWTLKSWPTSSEVSVEAWRERLSELAAGATAGGVVSVVPDVGDAIDAAARTLCPGWSGPLRPSAPSPSGLVTPSPDLDLSTTGADRFAAVAGAAALAPRGRSVVVVCAGTATTVEGVRALGDRWIWEGGAIAPGPDLLRRSLSDHTAALPLVDWPDGDTPPWGRSTAEAMRSGLAGLYAGGVEALVKSTAGALPGTPLVVATGGWAPWLAEYAGVGRIEATLILDGVRALVGDGDRVPA